MFTFGINNFRNFKEEIFNFKRVNILIGENSGGKSSLMKFLLALKQTVENPQMSNLILNGKQVELGTYKDTIHKSKDELNLEFNFSFGDELKKYFKVFIKGYFDETDCNINDYDKYFEKNTLINFNINNNLGDHSEIKYSFNNESLGELYIEFPKNKENKDNKFEIKTCIIIYKSYERDKEFVFDKVEYTKNGFLSIIDSISLKRECDKYKIENKKNKLFIELAIFLLNQNLIEFQLNDLKYLNPLNTTPKRLYLNKDSQNEYEKSDLEKFSNIITTNQITKKDFKEFEKVLIDFGIVDGIKIVSSNNLPVSEIKVKIKDLYSNICDVGYGVSLQIPILFEAFISEKEGGSTFIIEQPEVHLHPRLHSKFIETLLNLGPLNNYIIETHSEHIIRMLQVLVKDKEYNLNSEEVNIYYFSRKSDQFLISNHFLDENGIMNEAFPSGFYDNSFLLTKKLMF